MNDGFKAKCLELRDFVAELKCAVNRLMWEHSHLTAELTRAQEREKGLVDLVRHCWIHSGHRNNGFEQMTSEQKQMWSDIVTQSERAALTETGGVTKE